MAIDPYIARGVTPFGEGLPQTLLGIESIQQDRQRNRLLEAATAQRATEQQASLANDERKLRAQREWGEVTAARANPALKARYVAKVRAEAPELATLDDDALFTQIEHGLAATLGIDATPKAQSLGQLYQVTGPDGRPQFATAEQAVGANPYVKPEKGPAPVQQHRTLSPEEVKQYGLPDGTVAQQGPDGRINVIDKPAGPAAKPKVTEGERTAANYLGRMEAAEGLLGDYHPSFKDFAAARAVMNGGPAKTYAANSVLSPEGRRYYQAAADWVRAKLRKESGAVIAPQEMEQEIKTYFPLPNDDADTVKQKTQARMEAEAGMRQMGGGAVPESDGAEDPLGIR